MAKFYGRIGFTLSIETDKDVYDQTETSKYYKGELVRNQRRWESSSDINENLNVSNEISIVADDFLQENLGAVKWAECMGSKWKVNSISINYPRVVLTLGGVYNGG